jgi:hypothetical protein
MDRQTQDAYYKQLVDEILGANAWTPGRAMTRAEAMDPVLRQLIQERLGMPAGGYNQQPQGMLPRKPQ